MEPAHLLNLQKLLQYQFNDPELLMKALRHSSYVNEQTDPALRSNERLEFLGDAVLNVVIGHLLMKRYPDLMEGDLSRMRSGLVNASRLSVMAAKINLGDYLLLGKGELQTKGRKKKSILADAFEALVASVYLDGGFDRVFKIIAFHFADLIDSASAVKGDHDYKSRLQELAQETLKVVPAYTMLDANGPDHDKTFRVQVSVNADMAVGEGKTKKAAEQEAARKVLEKIKLR